MALMVLLALMLMMRSKVMQQLLCLDSITVLALIIVTGVCAFECVGQYQHGYGDDAGSLSLWSS